MHLMLMLYMSLQAQEVVSYNPDGFRHVLITAAQQLKLFGVVKEGDLDILGHWSRGLAMPRNHNFAAGVSEMNVRDVIMAQYR